jgi:hypothetical protein
MSGPGGIMIAPVHIVPGITGNKIAFFPEKIHGMYVVISKNKEQRLAEAGNNKIKVIQGKIPRAEYEVNITKPLLDISGINKGIDMV